MVVVMSRLPGPRCEALAPGGPSRQHTAGRLKHRCGVLPALEAGGAERLFFSWVKARPSALWYSKSSSRSRREPSKAETPRGAQLSEASRNGPPLDLLVGLLLPHSIWLLVDGLQLCPSPPRPRQPGDPACRPRRLGCSEPPRGPTRTGARTRQQLDVCAGGLHQCLEMPFKSRSQRLDGCQHLERIAICPCVEHSALLTVGTDNYLPVCILARCFPRKTVNIQDTWG
ncbi:uncharacterized protein LOC133049376 [Dama dama]|uniref:uncharacterized protein LOC133049376 n=1 Tax=Dama dama TaxID=30532 RepID=UPI002A37005E|nr:uncharacterized protein LOC133049376 [Dama dama]